VNNFHYFNSYDEAYNVAAFNNENDDEGWHYEEIAVGKYYRVAIYDECNVFVGYL